jgi:hypothetical protein
MRASRMYDVRTVDAERIDITVDSIKRYYGKWIHTRRNMGRHGTQAGMCPRLRLALFVFLFVIVQQQQQRCCYPVPSARVRPRGLFREITEGYFVLARKCAGRGCEIIPRLPRCRISASRDLHGHALRLPASCVRPRDRPPENRHPSTLAVAQMMTL